VTTCPRPENLYLYLEGELGPYDAAKLEEHVEGCAACRDALAERRVLHEAFTGLPPFEVPEDFARSVMDSLPEPEVRKAGWLAPLIAAVSALSVGLLGFNLFTGTSALEVLVAVNGFFGSALARVAPLLAKTLKLLNVLLQVAGGLVRLAFAGLVTFSRVLGPQGIAVLIGLGALLTILAVFGARRFLHEGERS
jgi:predicted anti-sigma-YlaC factor YlaD